MSDLSGYISLVDRRSLLEAARVARGLTQQAVARRSGTSQPTLSAYERGTKSPTLAVAERILNTLGFALRLQPRVTFREVPGHRGRTYVVPDQLWRVDPPDCFAPVTRHDPAGSRRTFDLLSRNDRVDAYAWLIERGDEEQLITHVDGALLVDAWPDVAPRLSPDLRRLWHPLVYSAGEAVLDQLLIVGLKAGRSAPLSRQARERLVKRLASRGLTAEQIRRVLAVARGAEVTDIDR